MMDIGIVLRVCLIAGSLFTLLFVLRRIRRSQVQTQDSVFWIFFAILLLFLSIFPEAASWISYKLGFEAPINLVYVVIIFLLLVQIFVMSIRVSQMDAKIRDLAQRMALWERETDKSMPVDEPAGNKKEDK